MLIVDLLRFSDMIGLRDRRVGTTADAHLHVRTPFPRMDDTGPEIMCQRHRLSLHYNVIISSNVLIMRILAVGPGLRISRGLGPPPTTTYGRQTCPDDGNARLGTTLNRSDPSLRCTGSSAEAAREHGAMPAADVYEPIVLGHEVEVIS